MKSINLVMLSGNIGQIKNLGTVDKPFVVITLAVRNDYKEKAAKEKNEEYVPDWHDVNLNGQNAKFTLENISIGDYVMVQGELSSSFYTPKESNLNIKKWVVQANEIVLIKKKENNKPE